MRVERLNLSIFTPNKLSCKRIVNYSKIPHYAYT